MYEDSLGTLEDELNLIRRENEELRDELVSLPLNLLIVSLICYFSYSNCNFVLSTVTLKIVESITMAVYKPKHVHVHVHAQVLFIAHI